MLKRRQCLNIDVKVIVFGRRLRVEVVTARVLFLDGDVSRLTGDEHMLRTVTLCLLVNDRLSIQSHSSTNEVLDTLLGGVA